MAPSGRDERQFRLVEDPENGGELVSTAEDHAGRGNDPIGALPAGEAGHFLHTEHGRFTGAPEDREDGAIFEMVDGVVAPLPFCDLAAIDPEDRVELPAVERHLARYAGRAGSRGDPPPNERAVLDFAQARLLSLRRKIARKRAG